MRIFERPHKYEIKMISLISETNVIIWMRHDGIWGVPISKLNLITIMC